MSYFVTKKYPQGTFCWADAFSTDIEATREFMTELFGWTSEDLPTDVGLDYTMFYLDGKEVAAASPMPKDMEGMPSFWVNHVAVDDVDEVVKKAEELGGTVTMPAMDVMDQGRMASITDPTGAALSLWEAKKRIGAKVINTPGAMSWNELNTHDLETAKEYYQNLFGWKVEYDEKADYHTISNNGRMNGGMLQIKPEWKDAPPAWMPYFTVESMDESVEKVKELGGETKTEVIEAGAGKMMLVADPTGAHFMIIEMGPEPEHWEE